MAKRILIYTNHYFPEQFKINDVVDWLKGDDFKIRVVTGIPNYPSGTIYRGYGVFSKNSVVSRSDNPYLSIFQRSKCSIGLPSRLSFIISISFAEKVLAFST